jgi:hypothetical protein
MSTKRPATPKIELAPPAAPAAETETIYTAKRTLKAWLTVLEDGGLLKPGATGRILTHRKLKRCAVPPARA